MPTQALSYDVFVNDPPPQDGVLPNGEPKLFSPMASTLISGQEDAVLTDTGMTTDQAQALGDWVFAKERNVTDIFVTHLDDADELLQTEPAAVDFVNAKIARYPDYLGRTVLWAGVSAIYGAREHPDQDPGLLLLNGFL